MARITVREARKWKRTPEEITTLARQYVQREIWVPYTVDELQSAFMLILTFSEFTEAATKEFGTIFGIMGSTTGMSINGLPVFTECGFIHKNDMVAFNAEVDRMMDALGVK